MVIVRAPTVVPTPVIITELFSGYPAMDSGKLFVGDVIISVNNVRITEVDMCTQVIKLAKDKVEVCQWPT